MKLAAVILMALCSAAGLEAAPIDFEGLPDGAAVTIQYPGATFTNCVIYTAGISLNEFEFPPRSGSNVASDLGGPITIVFSPPVASVSAYFTYLTSVTLKAFDSNNAQVATASSLFTNNELASGDAGSSPNELMQVASAGGISKVTITGNPAGGSFTFDDLTIGAPLVVPPPVGSPALSAPAVLLLGMLLAALGAFYAARLTQSRPPAR